MHKKIYVTPSVEVYEYQVVSMCVSSYTMTISDEITDQDAMMSREYDDGWNRSWKGVWDE